MQVGFARFLIDLAQDIDCFREGNWEPGKSRPQLRLTLQTASPLGKRGPVAHTNSVWDVPRHYIGKNILTRSRSSGVSTPAAGVLSVTCTAIG